MTAPPKLSVVLPAYNEAEAIGAVIDGLKAALGKMGIAYEFIVIDDASTDGTGEAARAKGVRIIRHPVNRGVGAARKTGILAAQSSLILTTDADGTYPTDALPEMVAALEDHDMVIGARTGSNVNESWLKKPPKFFIRKLACYLSRREIPDLNSGLRAFRREAALKYFYLLPDSHSWESTITLAFLCNGHPTKFLSVNYFKRAGGRSSFRPLADTYNYISLVIRTVMYFNPLRIFIPATAGAAALGAVKTVYDWIVYRHIGGLDVALLLAALIIAILGLLADLIVVTHRAHPPTSGH